MLCLPVKQESLTSLAHKDVDWADSTGVMRGSVVARLEIFSLRDVVCLMQGITFFEKLVFVTLGPMVVCLMLSVPLFITLVLGKLETGHWKGHPRYEAVAQSFWYWIFFWLFLTYPSTAVVSVSTFHCKHYGKDLLLVSDMRQQCPWLDRQSDVFLLAIFSVIFFVIGIPLFMLGSMVYVGVPRVVRMKMEAELVRALIVRWRYQKSVERLRTGFSDKQSSAIFSDNENLHCMKRDQLLALLNQTMPDLRREHDDVFLKQLVLREARRHYTSGNLPVSTVIWDASQEEEHLCISRMGHLFMSYRVSMWFFEIVVMVFKLLLTSAIVFFDDGSFQPFLVALLVDFLMLALVIDSKPYVLNVLNRQQEWSLFVLFVTILYGLLQHSSEGDVGPGSTLSLFVLSLCVSVPFLLVVAVVPAWLLSLWQLRGRYKTGNSLPVSPHLMQPTHPVEDDDPVGRIRSTTIETGDVPSARCQRPILDSGPRVLVRPNVDSGPSSSVDDSQVHSATPPRRKGLGKLRPLPNSIAPKPSPDVIT